MLDVVYTVAETAKLLKCSKFTVRSLIARGLLASKNLGTESRRELRIPCQSVEAFLDVEPVAAPPLPSVDVEDIQPVRFMKRGA
jgi:excisionase family DNA binding protein